MASLVNAVGDLFKSVYEIIASFVATAFHAVEGILATILNFFTSIVNLVGDVLGGVVTWRAASASLSLVSRIRKQPAWHSLIADDISSREHGHSRRGGRWRVSVHAEPAAAAAPAGHQDGLRGEFVRSGADTLA